MFDNELQLKEDCTAEPPLLGALLLCKDVSPIRADSSKEEEVCGRREESLLQLLPAALSPLLLLLPTMSGSLSTLPSSSLIM